MGGIKIIGLGPGDPGLLTRAAWEGIKTAEQLWLRTKEHPTVAALDLEGVQAFDHLYEQADAFDQVYHQIAEELASLAEQGADVAYAVPGDPTMGEASVEYLRQECERRQIPVEIIHGVSFVEPCLAMLGLDGLDGLIVVDALDLAASHHPRISPDVPVLVGQVYSTMVAGDVKLTLMNQYPDEYPVVLLHAAGTEWARLEETSLHALDHSAHINTLTSLYIPAMEQASSFEAFQETVAHLRAPDGCPWDREQTFQSLRQHLLEETYETLQAIDDQDLPALQEELGDLLLQVVLQAQIATEEGEFRMADVLSGIQSKLIRRHPHVFGETAVDGVEQVLQNWEALKQSERNAKGRQGGLLEGVPAALPALTQAYEVQARAARVGFDWQHIEGVLDSLCAEVEELKQARTGEQKFDELGDLLFSTVNYARWLDIDPEAALRAAAARFRRRFGFIETELARQGRSVQELSALEMDELWEKSKQNGL
ncbi:MAG: nucleoside triphosphate pyrophosphohydrolase [Anaerolineales bacterium]|jgi:tetrapyrrole methylase family protein/MazG family protein